MRLLTRELNCDAMYKLILSWTVVRDIMNLMNTYRPMEKKLRVKDVDRLIYVVFADCLGDVMDDDSSDACFTSGRKNFLFIDPYSEFNQWMLIAHELIHYFQQYMYQYPNESHYDDWTEIMARDLQYKVRDLICCKEAKQMIFKFVTEDPEEIDEFIDYKSTLDVGYLEDKMYMFEDVCRVDYI